MRLRIIFVLCLCNNVTSDMQKNLDNSQNCYIITIIISILNNINITVYLIKFIVIRIIII